MCAYANAFVVSLICNNQPQREYNEDNERVVRIPFGSEYSLRLKNMRDNKVSVMISIDGMNIVSGGGRFVLQPHEDLDLERFVEDLKEGKRFKFMSVEEGKNTGEIQDPYSKDNGLITVEIFEPEVKKVYRESGYSDVLRSRKISADGFTQTKGSSRGITGCSNVVMDNVVMTSSFDAGATVAGSTSSQQFQTLADHTKYIPAGKISIRIKGTTFSLVDTPWKVKNVNGKMHVYYKDTLVSHLSDLAVINGELKLTIDPKCFSLK
jgi:hypothetical protein